MNKRVTPSKRQRENEHHFNDVINVSTSPKMYFACLFVFLVILRKHIAHGHSLKRFYCTWFGKKKYWTVLGYLNAARSSRTDRLLLYFNSSSSSSAHSTGPHGTMSDSRSGLVFLITGGCGFLGRHLLRVLLDEEEDALAEVRIFDKHTELGLSELGTGRTKVTVIQGDITDYDSVLAASQGAHVVIHTASLVDVWHKVPEALIYAVNVTGTENVIKACVNNNVCCLLYTSSMEVIGPNMNREPFVRGNEDTPYEVKHTMAYPKSKAKAEKIVLEANGTKVRNGERLRTCSLRPTGIYGEGHELIKDFYKLAVKRGGLIIGGVPDTTEHGRVYVGNVAWMHVLAARALRERPETVGGEAFFCYDDSPYKSYEDFNMLFLSTFKFRRVRMPMLLLWFLAMLNDMLRWILTPFCNFAPLLNSYTLAVAITSFTVSTDKALRHFQYRPLYNWDQCRERTQGWVDTFPLEDPKNT